MTNDPNAFDGVLAAMLAVPPPSARKKRTADRAPDAFRPSAPEAWAACGESPASTLAWPHAAHPLRFGAAVVFGRQTSG